MHTLPISQWIIYEKKRAQQNTLTSLEEKIVFCHDIKYILTLVTTTRPTNNEQYLTKRCHQYWYEDENENIYWINLTEIEQNEIYRWRWVGMSKGIVIASLHWLVVYCNQFLRMNIKRRKRTLCHSPALLCA